MHSILQHDPISNNSIYGTNSSGDTTLMADLFFKTDDSNYNSHTRHKCGLLFSSPTNYSINYMHEFMFRASFLASTDADNQTISVQRSNVELFFRSNYQYLTAVMTAMLMSLFCLFSQVWAWWELEWVVTMSPIETASSLGAPILQQAGGRSAREILRTSGGRPVFDPTISRLRTNEM